MNELLDFIRAGDAPKDSETGTIEKIWEHYYLEFMNKLIEQNAGTPLKKYPFTKTERSRLKTVWVPLMKNYLDEHEEHFPAMELPEFFSHFMKHTDDWWKKNCFNVHTFSKHFNRIIHDIIIKGNYKDKQAKPTSQDVLADLYETK